MAVMYFDVDSFYCAAELLRRPDLVGKPLAVSQHNSGGFVSVSEEAKARGVRKGDGIGQGGAAALPQYKGRRHDATLPAVMERCPGLTVVTMQAPYYRQVSARVQAAITQALPPGAKVQKSSIDDFYAALPAQAPSAPACTTAWVSAGTDAVLAPSDAPPPLQPSMHWAAHVQQQVHAALAPLTLSVGVGSNRLLARLAGPCSKPRGLSVAVDRNVLLAQTLLYKVPGLGGKLGQQVIDLTLSLLMPRSSTGPCPTAAEAAGVLGSPVELSRGCSMLTVQDATRILGLLRGEDDSRVEHSGPPKSLMCEASFPACNTVQQVKGRLSSLTHAFARRLREHVEQHARVPAGSVGLRQRVGYRGMTSSTLQLPPAFLCWVSGVRSTQLSVAVGGLVAQVLPAIPTGITRLAWAVSSWQPLGPVQAVLPAVSKPAPLPAPSPPKSFPAAPLPAPPANLVCPTCGKRQADAEAWLQHSDMHQAAALAMGVEAPRHGKRTARTMLSFMRPLKKRPR